MSLIKTQIDKLGQRLRDADASESDLIALDEYRESFTIAYESVVQMIRENLGSEPAGRPAKTTKSITEKLRRETIRLSQMQDIAGCRLIVPDLLEQDNTVEKLLS